MSKRREYRLYGKRQTGGRRIALVGLFIFLLFLIHLIISGFLLDSYAIGSTSMTPTLQPNQRLFITPLIYGPNVPFTDKKIRPISTPDRGDLVVVQPPYFRTTTLRRIAAPLVSFFTLRRIRFESAVDFPFERAMLIRRIIGIPGDTVRIEDFTAMIRPEGGADYIEEFALSRSRYSIANDPLPEGWGQFLPVSGNSEEITLEADQYYVLSDNRSATNDSRFWGPVGIGSLRSKVLFRFWPFDSIGVPR